MGIENYKTNTENDFRAHHLQNYLAAHLFAYYSQVYNDADYLAVLNEQLTRIPGEMAQASLSNSQAYRNDTIGENQENRTQLIRGIQSLVDLYQTGEGIVSIGNLRDIICASCLIGSHCLKEGSRTLSKDLNLVRFIQTVFNEEGIYCESRSSEVNINNKIYEHTVVYVRLEDVHALMRDLSRYLYHNMEKYVDGVNSLAEKGVGEPIEIDLLFKPTFSRGFHTGWDDFVMEFVLVDSANPKYIASFLKFVRSV